MAWFVALIRFETQLRSATRVEPGSLGEISFRLIEARDEADADAIAHSIGKAEEVDYPNEENEEVLWRFVGVDELVAIEGEPTSGTELYSRLFSRDEDTDEE